MLKRNVQVMSNCWVAKIGASESLSGTSARIRSVQCREEEERLLIWCEVAM